MVLPSNGTRVARFLQVSSGAFRCLGAYGKGVNRAVEFILQDAHNAAMSGKTGLAGKRR